MASTGRGDAPLYMTAEVEADDPKSTGFKLLWPSKSSVVPVEVDRGAVQKDDRPARATNLEMQTNVTVLKGWQRSAFGESSSSHRYTELSC